VEQTRDRVWDGVMDLHSISVYADVMKQLEFIEELWGYYWESKLIVLQ
jgi:hypothetical protein